MAFSLSKLARDRRHGVRTPTWVERAIEITTQDFRVREGLRTRERQADLVARGASRTMHSRHLTRHAVNLVALDGEVRQREDYFQVAAAMHAAARDLEMPVCWGAASDSLLAIASSEDSVADYVAACRAIGQNPFLDGPHFELSSACRMIDWIKTAQRVAAIVPRSSRRWSPGGTSPCRTSCSRPSWRRFTAGPSCSTSSTVHPAASARPGPVKRQSVGMLWPEFDAAFVTTGGGTGRSPTTTQRQNPCRRG